MAAFFEMIKENINSLMIFLGTLGLSVGVITSISKLFFANRTRTKIAKKTIEMLTPTIEQNNKDIIYELKPHLDGITSSLEQIKENDLLQLQALINTLILNKKKLRLEYLNNLKTLKDAYNKKQNLIAKESIEAEKCVIVKDKKRETTLLQTDIKEKSNDK